MTLIGVYMLIKFRRACTWELFISQTFNYGKMASLFLFFLIDVRYAIYYAIYCLILWLMLTNPRYEGPSQIVRLRTTDQFLQFINKPGVVGSLKESSGYTLQQR